MFLGLLDQFPGGVVGVVQAPQDRRHLVVADLPHQAVAAQQEAVAPGGCHLHHVHGHLGVHTESPGEHMALGVVGGFVLPELPLVDEFLDQAVVHRELLEAPVAQAVGARVADVDDRHLLVALPVDQGHGHQRGPHAPQLGVGLGPLPHRPVGVAGRLLQGFGGDHLQLADRLAQGLHGHPGGDLAGGVAAHPVGHREQGRGHQQLVLVGRADQPHVGRRPGPQPGHGASSSTVLPTCRRSPGRRATGAATLWSLRKVPLVEPRSST